MSRSGLASLMFTLVACVTEKGPDPVGDDDAPGGPECVTDEDCGAVEICEEEACVEGDRDGSFAEATPILQNEVQSGVIAPAGDIDRYAYTALGPEWVRIETVTAGDPAENLDTVVRVFAENGAEHAVMDNFATGRVNTYDTVLHVFLPRAGTWYVTVEDVTTYYTGLFDEADQRGGVDFWYELNINGNVAVTGEADAMATPSVDIDVTSGSTIWSVGVNLEADGDADWIAIDHAFDGRPLDIFGQSTIPGSTARPRVRLYDGAGELVLDKPDLGEAGQASYFDASADPYTLEATDALGAGGADAWYVLYVRTYEEDDSHPFFGAYTYETELEPNDQLAAASPFTVVPTSTGTGSSYLGQYVQGRFDAVGDEDWFVLSVDADEKITVRCFAEDFGSLTDLAVALFDGGADLTPAGQGTTPSPLGHYLANVAVPGAGEYHVRLTSPSGASGPGAYYRCRLLQSTFDFVTE